VSRPASCPRCLTAGSMSDWTLLSANRNMQAMLTVLYGNTHKSTCACCGAVEQQAVGVTYHGDAIGFRVAA
jgi:hypothetical protein